MERERDSLGAGVPRYVITKLKSCPVERLGQYLNDTCSHHSHFSLALSISSVQFSLAQLNSKQLPVSLYDCYGRCHIASLEVFVWLLGDHRTKYPLERGCAGPDLLIVLRYYLCMVVVNLID